MRMGILENKTQAERSAFMLQLAAAELAHFDGSSRCADQLRHMFTGEQFVQLSRFCLDGLR